MNAVTEPGVGLSEDERLVSANGIQLCVQEMGDPGGEPLLLIMGLASQMTLWPDALLQAYVAAGFRVIRFDNRDIGRSEEIKARIEGSPYAAMLRYKLGLSVPAPYTLHDMAADAIGLLDALEIDSAHVVGVSMGGMIAQVLGATAAERVRSLTLIMTSTNSPRTPLPDPRVIWHLQGGGVQGHHEAAVVQRGLNFWRTVQSPAYPASEAEVRERITSDYRRSYRPWGILRQMRGILATGSLEPLTRTIRVPTRIIHGDADPLVRPAAARRLNHLIPTADLNWLRGMGHDLPARLLDDIARLTIDNAERA
ncbi:alpha/beta fold hydrolase [Mangrovitalea sediminis]|uniref:alpha/beta fold hydrolase n=1 Tax=Mangrovitalea sediminis TaxID=1982043 RepID=UPI000BE5C529|nr:alpha/beta hydrolase [Mangrovitalea sediminis]